MTEAVWIIVCAPLAACLLALLARGRSWERLPTGLACAAGIAAAITLMSQIAPSTTLQFESAAPWLLIPGVDSLEVIPSLVVDAWSAWLTTVVTVVGGLTTLYAVGEKVARRRLPPLCLSIFATIMVILAGNLLQLAMFWMLLGFSTCWLVGHDVSERKTNNAVRKAAIVLQIGSCGLLLATFLIWTTTGTLELAEVLKAVSANDPSGSVGMIGFGLLAAATAMCAQFPLLVWLPDGVEGPSPATALLQSLCPGVAGIHLLVRCQPLLADTPEVLFATAIVGGVSAVVGAYISLTQTQMPRLLAFSSVSHFGLILLAVGTGSPQGVVAAGLHLAVHACGKSLLCLAGVDQTGQPRVGNASFVVGVAGIVGLPLLSGFWSVTTILWSVREAAILETSTTLAAWWDVLFWAAVVSVFMGAYSLARGHLSLSRPSEQPNPQPLTIIQRLVLLLLVGGSLGLGAAVGAPTGWLAGQLGVTASWDWQADWQIPALCAAAATGGALAAWIALMLGRRFSGRWSGLLRPLETLSRRELFLNEVFFLGLTLPLRTASLLCRFVDWFLVDRIFVGLAGGLPRKLANSSRPLQNGLVQFYALVAVLVVGTVLVIALWSGGGFALPE